MAATALYPSCLHSTPPSPKEGHLSLHYEAEANPRTIFGAFSVEPTPAMTSCCRQVHPDYPANQTAHVFSAFVAADATQAAPKSL